MVVEDVEENTGEDSEEEQSETIEE